MISMPHIRYLGDGLANQLPNLTRRHNIPASSLSDIGRPVTCFEHVLDRELDIARLLFEIERVAQHHRRRSDRTARISSVLTRNVRRRAMHRLIKPDFAADA